MAIGPTGAAKAEDVLSRLGACVGVSSKQSCITLRLLYEICVCGVADVGLALRRHVS